MFGCLVGQIHFRDPDFLSVELVEGTSVITGPNCNKGLISHDWDNIRHVQNSLNMVNLTYKADITVHVTKQN